MKKFPFRWLRLLLVPLFGILFYACMIMVSAYNLEEEYYQAPWIEHLIAIAYCVIFISLLSEGSLFISRKLDNRLDWDTSPAYRFVVQLCLQTVYSIFAFVLLWNIVQNQFNYGEQVELNELEIRQVMVLSTAITMLVTAIYTGMIFFGKWKKSLLESERFKRESVQAQFDVLKNQVDPHFLFNTLNTLTTVIAEDQKLAIEFVEQMSQVYRYILQMKERKMVELSTEIEFAQAYVFLLKMRFGENLQVIFHIPEPYQDREIAPLTLQLLIENATKHNVISSEMPLHVCITVDWQGWLQVTNNLQPKLHESKSTEVGLKHLFSRYKLLTSTEPAIERTATSFIVKLPLLHQINATLHENSAH